MFMKANAFILLVSHFSLLALPAFSDSSQQNITLPDASTNSTLSHSVFGGVLIPWTIANLGTAGWLFYDLHQYRIRNRAAPSNADIEMIAVGNSADPIFPFDNMSPSQRKTSLLIGRRICVSALLTGDAFGTAIASAFLGGVANVLPEGSGQKALNIVSYVGAGLTLSLLILATSGAFTHLAPKNRADIVLNHVLVPSMLTLFGLTSVLASVSLFDAGRYTQKPPEDEL